MTFGDSDYVQQIASRYKVVENIYKDTVCVGLAFQFKAPQQTEETIKKNPCGYI